MVPQDPRLVDRLRQAGAAAAWLFGSHARGQARSDSDIDIAVLRDAPMPLLELSRLTSDLEALLGAAVDVVDFLTAPLEVRARVVLDGCVLFSDDEPRRVAETVLTQSRWEDVRRSVGEMDRSYLDRVAHKGLA